MDREPRSYLVVFQLSISEIKIAARLTVDVPIINEVLKRISVKDKKPLLAFRSKDGETFGYFIRSKLHQSAVISQIESPGSNQEDEVIYDDEGEVAKFVPAKKPDLTSPTKDRDRIFVIEIGRDFHCIRYEGLMNWFR